MKRHKNIIALSHDHHHGLMLAQLIKKNAPEYKGLPTDLIGKVNHVKDSWEKELNLHFENEENILFPFVKGKDEEIDKLIEEVLEEHKLIESLVKKLDTHSDIESTLDQLGKALESHIRKEERELFQKIQLSFGEELNKLEGKIIAVKDDCGI
ncbi:MAG: hemerythrin domain-containing protein [Bdellovibrionales bacterium]|nr:hemerythrin domain-containing protein [Bdellovibrionales bacterium]